jgi:stress-induced morphogen
MNLDQMKKRLEECFPESKVDVLDLTGTSDHWEVFVESQQFQGLNRIQQHQKVMACFGPELKTGEVHALSIKTVVKPNPLS